jgi:hypothetical protein
MEKSSLLYDFDKSETFGKGIGDIKQGYGDSGIIFSGRMEQSVLGI